jgi:hypothetical protein
MNHRLPQPADGRCYLALGMSCLLACPLFGGIACHHFEAAKGFYQVIRIGESNRLDQRSYGFPLRSDTESPGTNVHQKDVAVVPLDIQFFTDFGLSVLGVEFQNDMAFL